MNLEIIFTEEDIQPFVDQDFDVSFVVDNEFKETKKSGIWEYTESVDDSYEGRLVSGTFKSPLKVGDKFGEMKVTSIKPIRSDMIDYPVWSIEVE